MNKFISSFIIILLTLFFLGKSSQAQVDTTKYSHEGSIKNTADEKTETTKKNKKEKYQRVSDLKVYGGVNASKIAMSGTTYESGYSTGYNAGIAYRKGRFFYWQIGAHYNGSIVLLKDLTANNESLTMSQLEAPLILGINLLSPLRRAVGIRVFSGISPGFLVGVSNNNLGLTTDDFNSFQVSGQVGAGVDVIFLFIEVGYNHGLTDLLVDNNSKLSQVFFNIGFRF